MNRRTFLTSLAAVGVVGCKVSADRPVVVYTALDEIYSRPILDAFQAETRLAVEAVYDTEASKTTGLVTRLINEAGRPRCDVFWNNECAQTIRLKEKGVLAAYAPKEAEAIPAAFKDPEGFWTGFAARARVIIYNTERVPEPPGSIHDFLKPERKGQGAVALPLFGTTATHAAALYAAWGPEKGLDFFRRLGENGMAILASNGEVRDRVARGEFAFGLTDTDDAHGAVEDGLPAKWLLPDQGPEEMGTLLIPNTVSLIKGAPNPDGAKALMGYLLSPAVEARLAAARSIQIPLNPAVTPPAQLPPIGEIRTMQVAWADVAGQMERAASELSDLLLR